MTKVVIIDENKTVCARVTNHTGAEHRRLANAVMKKAIEQAGVSFDDMAYVVSTGYGRMTVPFADRQLTELTCHARGVVHAYPEVRFAVDIGGQDAKGLEICDGKLIDFTMSDKCAAGTGRFLELMADALGLGLNDLGRLSLKATRKAAIRSTCSVFARQEVVARMSEGIPIEDILAGVHDAVAGRVAQMVARLNVSSDVVFTGGVAKNSGVVKALEENLGRRIIVPEEPLLSGALGAALLGREIVLTALARGKPIRKGARSLSEATLFQ